MFKRLAEKAHQLGKTPGEFAGAAQKHANAFWGLLLITGVIWYFFDWWAVIPAMLAAYKIFQSISSTKVAEHLAKMEPSNTSGLGFFQDVIRAYGDHMQFKAPQAGCVADTNELPFPKLTIKEALTYAIQATTDQQSREQLKMAYLQLADWQDGVGNKHLGIDVGAIGDMDDIEQQANLVVENMKKAQDFLRQSSTEMDQLKSELDQMGA